MNEHWMKMQGNDACHYSFFGTHTYVERNIHPANDPHIVTYQNTIAFISEYKIIIFITDLNC